MYPSSNYVILPLVPCYIVKKLKTKLLSHPTELKKSTSFNGNICFTEHWEPELAKITGRDLGFHFDDLFHLKLVLGWRSRYGR